ncbi:MAG: 16S rRNA (cytosine(967)-C(5))-methyltransferase RsmB [Aquabacterium sp.]|jgi:16S rRNA (cytosine967-C5)-methyltransferase|uniref:16S rRNA (cytosine(967)-C(5))-methyltransferase RsmB n=1 Tax=Aquabacterium sp. TaxID=1872578 RepID=UPI001B5A32BB|nr:16S rRNA (cytosine(967)-C(5))-methyltransferase RsmB [Aquabacterium sp.]MBP7132409.1 16S rRNA (cytosine(967)-C(5))-methyltransferase RsmB [Aquabacterium sp.]
MSKTVSISPPPSLPLWQLLSGCADTVAAVRQGQSLTDALAARKAAERPGVQALSFAVLRRLGTAQALRARLVPKAPQPWVDALLLSALALACGTEYNAHTLVDQAVEAAKRRTKPASGLVNAVLRRFLREQATLLDDLQDDLVAHFNHPAWWIKRLQHDWPEHWQAILLANQEQPPMTLRANLRHGSTATYRTRLIDAGLLPANAPLPLTDAVNQPQPIVLPHGVPVQRLPGFDQGDVSVQDTAAQMAAPLLVYASGQLLPAGARVLDACAAPGGKTAHLLELADLDLTALDADPERLVRVTETLQRLRLQARTVAADASQPANWWDGQPFDAILLDAPCSASGIVRRHPDVRWLRRDTDIAALARTQDAILNAMWPLLKPGGHLLYCTCSVFKMEGQDRIDAFLQRTPDAQALAAPGHLLPVVEYLDPTRQDRGDGFFYALLTKSPLGS